jgi:geranylgeranyl diphosphate synthase type I
MSLTHLKNFIQKFNPLLEETLSQHLNLYPHPQIQEAVAQVLPISRGGKRVRPYLANLMDSPQNHALHQPIYESLELIHLFALVHDDIMDECDTRRSEETIHSFTKKLYPNLDSSKQSRITESIAILVGDIIFSLAEKQFISVFKNSSDVQSLSTAYEYFCQLKEQVIYGQLLDLHLTSEQTATKDEVYDKTFYKTASYTVIKPMQIGCVLAGREDLLQFAHDFGTALGVAFQIQDDYINLTQPEEVTGKPQFSDVLEGQKTFFTVFLQEHSDQSYWRFYQSFQAHKSLTQEERDSLCLSLTDSQALEAGKQEFTGLFQAAETILQQNQAQLSPQSYLGLTELLAYLKNRKS